MIGSCIFTRMRQCVLVVAHTQSIYYIAGLVSSAADTTRAPADSRIARMLTRVAWGPAFKVPACELARSAARLGLKVGPFFVRSSPTTATPQCPLLDVTSLLTPTLPKLLRRGRPQRHVGSSSGRCTRPGTRHTDAHGSAKTKAACNDPPEIDMVVAVVSSITSAGRLVAVLDV